MKEIKIKSNTKKFFFKEKIIFQPPVDLKQAKSSGVEFYYDKMRDCVYFNYENASLYAESNNLRIPTTEELLLLCEEIGGRFPWGVSNEAFWTSTETELKARTRIKNKQDVVCINDGSVSWQSRKNHACLICIR